MNYDGSNTDPGKEPLTGLKAMIDKATKRFEGKRYITKKQAVILCVVLFLAVVIVSLIIRLLVPSVVVQI